MERYETLARLQASAAEARPPSGGDSLEEQLRASRDEVAHLEVAVEHRTVIGQAVGMLMERFGLDAETAFGLLARVSQESNRKVFVIAHELCDTGHSKGLG